MKPVQSVLPEPKWQVDVIDDEEDDDDDVDDDEDEEEREQWEAHDDDDGDGDNVICHSPVGFKDKSQGVSLGFGCRDMGTVVHETLHNLGFYHEQSRPDRDLYIKLNMTNVQKGHEKNFLKMYPPLIDTQNLPYDYNSIMHYGPHAFAIDRAIPTIIPLKKNVVIGQRSGMSQLDIIQLQRLYKCPERQYIPIQDGHTVSPNCTFDGGLCGWQNVTMDPSIKNNTWLRQNAETLSLHTGPLMDHTIGAVDVWHITLRFEWDGYVTLVQVTAVIFSIAAYLQRSWSFVIAFVRIRVMGREETREKEVAEEKWHKSCQLLGAEEAIELVTEKNSYYLFTEASSNYHSVAKIRTPKVTPGKHCLQFWYHMYGKDMGTLKVNIVTDGQKAINIVKISGNKGNVWLQSKTGFTATENTQVEFESITGEHYRSDMAIDDVIVQDGTC
uniref:Metalloendopeptidase n=1 Tax=Octopus bimaculoides TaxID=37653 RepID=A0A0L8H576_OCTBM